MPIILNDDNTVVEATSKGVKKVSAAAKKAFSPSFFNSVLTGRGGNSRGLLNEGRDPKHHTKGYSVNVDPNMEMGKASNGNITIYNIPFYMLKPCSWDWFIKNFERPDLGEMTKIAENKNGDSIYMTIPIHAIQIEEVHPQNNIYGTQFGTKQTAAKDLSACFHLFLFKIKDQNIIEHAQTDSIARMAHSQGNTFYQKIIQNMFSSLREVADELNANGYTVDKVAMNDFFQNYSLYVEICKAAERWQTKADYFIADVFAKNAQSQTSQNSYRWADPWSGRNSIPEALTRFEKYSIPLNTFPTMYQKLKKYTTPDLLTDICRSNLNLMLSDTLQHMNANRANLKYCPDTDKSMAIICPDEDPTKTGKPYSNEQKAAITSTSPLTLVQSGAGTGKSTIILARIRHMIANGIDPSKILVLSFTNNAANHILEKNPSVNSMTIDKMMRLIYSANYPDHQLSSISTILNSLDIYFDVNSQLPAAKRDFINNFKRILQRLRDDLEFTNAMNFIEDNLDDVIDALDTIGQTSLELQGIICYLKMDVLVEPPEVQAEHLIIDEVQDNSISQFVYSIKYTDKHQCSLYIVGDCSQTLYEFRASNPKALNVLEGSGVFATFKLQTNYRSNQEILDFANIGLSNIEANQYAKIQLHANSLAPVTLQSFEEAVHFHYERMPNRSTLSWDALYAKSANVMKDYIEEKIRKGEQVTILAHKKMTIEQAAKQITALIPNVPVIDKTTGQPMLDSNGNEVTKPIEVASLVPSRQYDNTILSKFIAKYWNTIRYAPPINILTTISNSIQVTAPSLVYRSSNLAAVQKSARITMDAFKAKFESKIIGLQNDVQASIITQAQMLDEIKKYMISFEIERNGIAQAVMSSRNNEAKTSEKIKNANIIISTIHSAKGLEFDNVIIYYDGASEAKMDEADKRMYYVALTRAKKTEFIFAYDTLAKPKIGNDYTNIIKQLTALQNATPIDNADDDDDDANDDDKTNLPNAVNQ